MKLIFVAGPFKAKNTWEVEKNVRKAEETSLALWGMGYAVICPHTNSRFFLGTCSEDIFLDGYQEILKRCDGVMLLSPGGQSKGTIEEIKLAERLGIPVFGDVLELSAYFFLGNQKNEK